MAWDLIYFSYRMEEAPRVENVKQIERHHLIWLLSALSLGLLFAALALYIELTLNFWIVVVLSVLLVWGISKGVRKFKDSGL